MKAEINKQGILAIIPESELEEYALDKWIEENYDTCSRTLKEGRSKYFLFFETLSISDIEKALNTKDYGSNN